MNQTRPKSTLLGRLRSAVARVRILLGSHTAATWRMIAVLRSNPQPRHLSLADRRPSGLMEAVDSAHRLSNGSTPGRVLHRTTSCPESEGEGEEDDVDRKAEVFIANFYRQLRLEKQVSLELRYCRGLSFGSYSDRSNSNRSLASPT